jgi:hypothetical protein
MMIKARPHICHLHIIVEGANDIRKNPLEFMEEADLLSRRLLVLM